MRDAIRCSASVSVFLSAHSSPDYRQNQRSEVSFFNTSLYQRFSASCLILEKRSVVQFHIVNLNYHWGAAKFTGIGIMAFNLGRPAILASFYFCRTHPHIFILLYTLWILGVAQEGTIMERCQGTYRIRPDPGVYGEAPDVYALWPDDVVIPLGTWVEFVYSGLPTLSGTGGSTFVTVVWF